MLYATGLRCGRRAGSESIGGLNIQAAHAGPQGFYVGFHQVNVPLQVSLAGRGDVPLVLSVAGNSRQYGAHEL